METETRDEEHEWEEEDDRQEKRMGSLEEPVVLHERGGNISPNCDGVGIPRSNLMRRRGGSTPQHQQS